MLVIELLADPDSDAKEGDGFAVADDDGDDMEEKVATGVEVGI